MPETYDRVRETSTTTGTGSFTLAGAVAGFRTFASVLSVSDTCWYCAEAIDNDGIPTGDWEVGVGTLSGATTLARTSILASSNSGSAVSFAAGTKNVFITFPGSPILDLTDEGDTTLHYHATDRARANHTGTQLAATISDFSSAVISAGTGTWQPLDADLTTWAGLTPSANAQSLVTAANYAAMRALLDLEAGTDFYSIAAADAAFQPKDATLTAFAVLTIAANSLTIGTGADAFSQTTFAANTFPARASTGDLVAKAITDFGLSLVDDADAATARSTLGLGSAAVVTTDLSDLNEATIEAAIDTLANLTSVQSRTVTLADAGFDVLFGWDDSGSAYKNFALADIASEAAPAAGDYALIYGAEGDLRKVDWSGIGLSITGLTEVDPALDDFAAIADTSDSNNNKKVAINRTLAQGAHVVEGRLTLTTAVPVTTADVTAASTLYFTPYNGNRVRVYDGTRWIVKTFAELSLALTMTSGKNYDVFLDDDGVTLSVVVWTDDSTRATGLTTQDGVYVKSGDATKLYLGTIRASGANTTEDSNAKRFVWNAYNRVRRSMSYTGQTGTWTYTTASYRQANATSTNRLEAVFGLASDSVAVRVACSVSNSTGNIAVAAGVGVDSTTVNSAQQFGFNALTTQQQMNTFYEAIPVVGYHAYNWLEISQAIGTTTWIASSTNQQGGIIGNGWF